MFSPLQKETLYLLAITSQPLYHTLPNSALGNHPSAFYLYGFVSSGHFIQMESFNMWPFMTCFFLNWRIVKDSHNTGESEVFRDSFLHLCKGTYNNNKDKMKGVEKERKDKR